jgi:uncharacterized protein (DUF1800 family)
MVEQDQNAKKGRIWDRPATRRAMLAAGATGAAGGAAALVFGLSSDGDGGSPASAGAVSTATQASTATPSPTATATAVPGGGQVSDAQRRAGHLLRRAGFGGTPEEIEEFASLSREEAARRLVDYEDIDNSALEAESAQFDIYDRDGAYRQWLTRMARTAHPLEERMAFIWHGLLVSQISQLGGNFPRRIRLMDDQIGLYRSMALPVYDDLLKAVSKDPAMMVYLNTIESTKEHPNENYGRELLELFSMGVGMYTEDDVRESARAFTGWRVTPPKRPTDRDDREEELRLIREWEPRFIVNRRQHDDGLKTFLGETGNWDGDDIVDIVMASPAPGRFVTRRLFTEFVHDHPSEESLDALEAVWDDTGHDVREVVRAILVSDEFYSEEAYRAKVRSPVEMVVGAVRGLGLDWDFRGIERVAIGMGQTIYNPPNVAGWPGGESWLSSGTFFARVNFIDILLFHVAPRDSAGSRVSMGVLSEATTAEEAVDIAVAALIDGDIPDSSRQLMYEYVASAPDPDQRQRAAAYLALASPEFQTV